MRNAEPEVPGLSGAGASRRGWRAALATPLRVVVSLGLLALLVNRLGLGALADAALGASPAWLLAALAAMLVSNLLGSLQWKRLLVLSGIRLPTLDVIEFYHVGLFFNNFLPTTIGGDLSRVVDAGRASGRRSAVIGATLVDRLLGMTVIGGLALTAILLSAGQRAVGDGSGAVLITIISVAAAAIVGLAALLSNRVSLALRVIAGRLPARARGPALDLIDDLEPLRRSRALAISLLGVSLVIQVLRVSTHVLVAQALDIGLEVVYFFLFVPVLTALIMLPISINGIGVRESMGAVLFGTVGVSATDASAMQFLAYVVAAVASLVGGVLFMTRGSSRRRAS